MASKKHRKRLKRIHLSNNSKKYLKRAEKDFIEAMDSLAKAYKSSTKFLTNFTSKIANMEVLKIDEGVDYIICESCTKQCTDIENMQCDSGSNWFCPECWEELAPVMKAEYEELKANGEID
ncbi:hypothetical protein [Chryseobacterium gambrini]|uniref:hypothetical protein n=1 Tax=Chryseobacterium gambrini TaxID=373672 RepID=UPI003D09BAF7